MIPSLIDVTTYGSDTREYLKVAEYYEDKYHPIDPPTSEEAVNYYLNSRRLETVIKDWEKQNAWRHIIAVTK